MREVQLRGPVKLILPPDINLLATVRLVVASLVSDLNLTYEQLQELKLLVGEAYVLALALSSSLNLQPSELEVEVEVNIPEMCLMVTYRTSKGSQLWLPSSTHEARSQANEATLLDTEGLRLQLIRSLADELSVDVNERSLSLRLTKRLGKVTRLAS